MDEDSNATVLMEDDPPLDTFSSTCDTTKVRKVVVVGGGNWITGAIQDKIFRCINFHAMAEASTSGEWHHQSYLSEIVGGWKVHLEDPLLAEWVNKMMMTAAKTQVTATICIAALKEGVVVDQIMNAIKFEEIKARAIVVILRNKSRGAQLSGIVEKGKAQDGKMDGHDCLIRG
jgi:hypothetical protein